ncbi:MAG: phosphatase PAP2 family protein [Puniceicoccales bacterium]|jgi:membrane-associated phospholipid phosphatase|nr:phosphatase PAP2 family protein [Puniceicoccales bacterium]
MDVFSLHILKHLDAFGTFIFAVIGFLVVDQKRFGQCLLLMFFTITYNVVLKNIFKVDLPATCPVHGHGFGFPSGHMHFIAIFYLELIYFYKNKIVYLGACTLMLIIGSSMVIRGYHYTMDIVGAILFAAISVMLFNFIFKKIAKSHFNCLFVAGVHLLAVFVLFCQIGFVPKHVWGALYGMCITCIVWGLWEMIVIRRLSQKKR